MEGRMVEMESHLNSTYPLLKTTMPYLAYMIKTYPLVPPQKPSIKFSIYRYKHKVLIPKQLPIHKIEISFVHSSPNLTKNTK